MIRASLMIMLLSLITVGCQSEKKLDSKPAPEKIEKDDHAGHDHPTHGPHGGEIIELGNEEYHAEFIHETDETVAIYVLDNSAKKMVPIESKELIINVVADGKPSQYKLTAKPRQNEKDGNSSRFVYSEKDLGELLEKEGVKAKLALTIAGKSYSGSIEHDHDH